VTDSACFSPFPPFFTSFSGISTIYTLSLRAKTMCYLSKNGVVLNV